MVKGTIALILELAINAPSANNLQPWEFIVVMDKEKERLSRTLIKAYREKQISCSSGAVKPLSRLINKEGFRQRNHSNSVLKKSGSLSIVLSMKGAAIYMEHRWLLSCVSMILFPIDR